jgi:hypothetical protein
MDSSVQPTPGFLPGATGVQAPAPVQAPLGGGAAGAPTDQMQQLLKMILSGAQQKPQMAQPVPAPIPGAAKPHQALVGKHTGPANLGSLISSTVQNAVHYDKAKKLAAATSDWKDLLTSTQKYMTPDGKVDPKAYQDPAVMQVLGDPKKLKRMAKALNQSWLDPKPDEYADGMKIAIQQHQKQQGAIQGLKQTMQQMVQHIRGQDQKQQQQIGPQGAASIMSRAPIEQGRTDPAAAKDATSMLLEQMKEQSRATQDAQKNAYTEARDDFKEKANQFRETQRQNFQTNLQSMRDLSAERRQADRDKTMLEGLGIRLSAKDKDKIGGMTPAQINTELNGSLTSMRQQLSQASSELRTLQSHADKLTTLRAAHPIMGPGGEEVDEAKTELESARASQKSLQQAISFIESKRGAIVSGKMDMDQVIDQAQKIMTGDLSDLGGQRVGSSKEAP